MNFDTPSPPPGSDQKLDAQMVQEIQTEVQKAKMQQQVNKLNELCWSTCVDKPRDRLDGRTETCVSNCVERFIDTSLLVQNRFQQLLQKSAGQM